MHPAVEIRPPGSQPLFVLLPSALVVGREGDGLRVADPQVSRRHLEIRPDGGRVLVSDLGSRNGTLVDGVSIDEPTLLEHDSVVTIGDTTIRLYEPAGVGPAGDGRQTTIATSARSFGNDDADGTDGQGGPGESGDADLRRTSIDIVAAGVAEHEWAPMLEGETVTILFSDIESSTERASEMGDVAWFALLEAHNRLFREELARTGGREIKSQGDGFMLTFSSVRRALRFSVAVQRRLADESPGGLRVRMGLHTGEAIYDTSGDLFGRHVNKAARVANLAVGGQVLASATVREIAVGADEFRFEDGIEVDLKGLTGRHVVHDLVWSEPSSHG